MMAGFLNFFFDIFSLRIKMKILQISVFSVNTSRVKEKKLYTFFNVVDVGQFQVNGGTFETWEILYSPATKTTCWWDDT